MVVHQAMLGNHFGHAHDATGPLRRDGRREERVAPWGDGFRQHGPDERDEAHQLRLRAELRPEPRPQRRGVQMLSRPLGGKGRRQLQQHGDEVNAGVERRDGQTALVGGERAGGTGPDQQHDLLRIEGVEPELGERRFTNLRVAEEGVAHLGVEAEREATHCLAPDLGVRVGQEMDDPIGVVAHRDEDGLDGGVPDGVVGRCQRLGEEWPDLGASCPGKAAHGERAHRIGRDTEEFLDHAEDRPAIGKGKLGGALQRLRDGRPVGGVAQAVAMRPEVHRVEGEGVGVGEHASPGRATAQVAGGGGRASERRNEAAGLVTAVGALPTHRA